MFLIAKIAAGFARAGAVMKGVLMRVAAIENRSSSFGATTVTLTALAAGATQDVNVSFVQPMLATNYDYRFDVTSLTGISLGSLQITVKSKAADKMVFTVKNMGVVIMSGSFVLGVKVQMV